MNTYSLRSFSLAAAPLTFHMINPPPAFVPVGPIPHAEVFFLPMRYGVAFAKLAMKVEFDGSSAVLLSHDMGFLIPHVPYGPPTPVLAAHIAFSKCQVLFGKATVLIEGQQAGWWYWFAMLQVCANPVPIPVGVNVSFFYTTVKFGFSWGDLICGYIRVGMDMLLTHLVNGIFRHPKIKDLFNAWCLRMTDRLYPVLGPIVARIGVGRFTIGFFNYEIIHQSIRKVPSLVKRFIVGPLVGGGRLGSGPVTTPQMYPGVEDGLGPLSRSIDEALADEPPPPSPSQAAAAPLLDPVPVLE